MSSVIDVFIGLSSAVFLTLGLLFFFPPFGRYRAIFPEKRLPLLENRPVVGWIWLASGFGIAAYGILEIAPGGSLWHYVFILFCCIGVASLCVSRIFPRFERPAWAISVVSFLAVAAMVAIHAAA